RKRRKSCFSGPCGCSNELLLQGLAQVHGLREKTVGTRLAYSYPDNVADVTKFRIYNNWLQPWRTPNHLPRLTARLFHQNVHFRANEAGGKCPLLLEKKGLQRLQALVLHMLGHMVVHAGTGCTRPRRIFERKGLRVIHPADKPHRVLEICVRLAREADDEIAG